MKYVRPNINAMSGYVPGEQPQGGKFIKLNTNENPYPASPKVAVAIQAALTGGLGKYPDPLATGFRMRAADVLGIEPNWVLCGNGSDDILTMMVRTFVDPGEVVRYPYPTYILYRTLAQIQNAETEEVRFNADWSLPAAFVAGNEKLRIAFLANPNSPSGTMLAPDEIRKLADALPCPLLVDEAYADFAETSCIDLVRENEKNHGFAEPEQILRPGRFAIWVCDRATTNDRATGQSQRLVQLRHAINRRGDCGH